MTTIKVNLKSNEKASVEIGQFYLHDSGCVYILSLSSRQSQGTVVLYSLLNLQTGGYYLGPVYNIKDVFGMDYEDFRLLTTGDSFTVTID